MKLNSLKLIANQKLLLVRKYSPEILVGVGIVGLVASSIELYKASTKASAVIAEHKFKIESINKALELAEKDSPTVIYTKKDRMQDLAVTYVQSGVAFAKLYGPAALLGGLSIACILGSHNIMRNRNLALMGAYKLLDEGFKNYRQRVVEDFGEQVDYNFKNGIREEVVEETEVDPETGKKKKVRKTKKVFDANGISSYAKFFDELNIHWEKDPSYNLTFLKTQQNTANDMLHARGHLFLNEVYTLLGIDQTTPGCIVGWMDGGDGDNYVDFGIFNKQYDTRREFVNGRESAILLDFNVDGVIYDLI